MNPTLVFATNNQYKIEEIRAVLPHQFSIITLKEAGIVEDIPEPFDTLEENALTKAQTIYNITGSDCFSEDTGLEVKSLNGLPGVHSAHYAGKDRSPQKNMEKLLSELEGKTDRTARFRTVICLLIQGETHYFEGICEGLILEAPQGSGGFGYDPIFQPIGADTCFGEMSLEEKNRFSHRRKAVEGLVAFLNRLT